MSKYTGGTYIQRRTGSPSNILFIPQKACVWYDERIMVNTCSRLSGRFHLWCKSSLRVGVFLAVRQLRRTNPWTTGLIVFIMVLTFLNLVFVSGILSGLVEGSSIAYRTQYSGDLILSHQESKNYIEDTTNITRILNSFPEVIAVTPRMLAAGSLEANYKEVAGSRDNPDTIGTTVAGIDPVAENTVTHLEHLVVSGNYLTQDDTSGILIGSNLLEAYGNGVPGDETLAGIDVGSTVRLRINGSIQEFIVRGVVKSKISEVGRRVYIHDTLLRQMIGRANKDANEISVLLTPGTDPLQVKAALRRTSVCDCAIIKTWQESQGQFFTDIAGTFGLLGNLIGAIGITVASVTIFIVIFINAVTRRKYIGILKGIGVCSSSIIISYIIQSLVFAITGSLIGAALLYGFLMPYVNANPIDFPFSDGILVAPVDLTALRVSILLVVTVIAGYLPAKIIVSKNTLDSILGR
ncbi:MAG: hypothetical protein HGA67_00205 [Candidatus Yonathbacteria bacterium]|nr:hypothetical protein [Candidatus Yonathbacteria bacterium]